MSELVVDLTDPESVALARQVLELVSNDWPNTTTSGASVGRNTGAVSGSASASASQGSQIDPNGLDDDPWATSAPSTETPRAAGSAPSGASSADTDDDNPWS